MASNANVNENFIKEQVSLMNKKEVGKFVKESVFSWTKLIYTIHHWIILKQDITKIISLATMYGMWHFGY